MIRQMTKITLSPFPRWGSGVQILPPHDRRVGQTVAVGSLVVVELDCGIPRSSNRRIYFVEKVDLGFVEQTSANVRVRFG